MNHRPGKIAMTRRQGVALLLTWLAARPGWAQHPPIHGQAPGAPYCAAGDAGFATDPQSRPRWWRRGAAADPIVRTQPIVPEPAAGVLTVEFEAHVAPTCDPVLAGVFLEELQSAVNARPLLRVTPPTGAPHLEPTAGPALTSPAAPPLYPLQEPLLTGADLFLSVHLRAIEPYRPMRLDAALELRDAFSDTVLARIDDDWRAPVDTVPLRPTRSGWLRRNWHPVPAVTEGAALEAASPRQFLRSTARRLAETLEASLPAGVSPPVSGSGPSVPAAAHPRP